MRDTRACVGCRNDFYNDKNPLGVKRCWSLASAKMMTRWQIGTWTPQDDAKNFTKVRKPSCYHSERGLHYYNELPSHLVQLKRRVTPRRHGDRNG